MGKVIKNFGNWQKVNETGSWLDSVKAMANQVGAFVSGGNVSALSAPTASSSDAASQSATVKPETEVNRLAKDKTKSSAATGKESTSAYFDKLDLSATPDFEKYEDACNAWIDLQKPFFNSKKYHSLTTADLGGGAATPPTNRDYVIGKYFADSAKKWYTETGNYVPWELAMAQITQEGGLSSTGKYPNGTITRPIKTKNPFNVGNTDKDPATGKSAQDNYFDTIPEGIDAYYKLMTTMYLEKRTPDELIQYGNFKNSNDNNYATDKYADAIADMVTRIKNKIA